QLHNEQFASGGAPSPGAENLDNLGQQPPAGHEQHGAAHSGAVASRAEVEEIDGGAQIVLTPRDPSQVQALRQEARQQAQVMSGGECPVLEPAQQQGSPSTGG
ncbi:MAG: hypothetical protein H5U40_12035, partial [Polyangiaceae bacterium]|nr:hypothetical protein [Polyangiaceae bacterium]